jgi:hypothetical protein
MVGAARGTWEKRFSPFPASKSKTFQLGTSVSLLAITAPADPEPTIIKS